MAATSAVTGFEPASDGRFWHLLAEAVEPAGSVVAVVEPAFRAMMAELHTGTHILNALVFQQFDRALVTGAQLNDDATARMDFDLPDADNDKLRALEAGLNDLIRQDLPLRYTYVPLAEATAAARPHPQPLGGAAAGRRRAHPHRGDRGARPSGVRRDAPGLDRPLAPAADLEDRQQGPPQPPHPHRPGELRRGALGRSASQTRGGAGVSHGIAAAWRASNSRICAS